jgi:uncharacterized protein (TIGR02246 family)
MADLAALARQWFDTLAARDFDKLATLYTPDAEYVRSDGSSKGIGEILEYVRGIAGAFPDETARIESVLVAPDGVTVEWREDATHLAPYKTAMGVLPPTGKGFRDERICTIFRFDGDKIASQREYYDTMSMARQFGWLELMAKAAAAAG